MREWGDSMKRFAVGAVALLFSAAALAQQAGLPEVAGSSVGYPTPNAALLALRSRPDVKFSTYNRWTIATDRADLAVWSFPPPDHPASPAVVKRKVYQVNNEAGVRTSVLCGGTKPVCDKLVLDFQTLTKATVPHLAQ